MTLRSLTLLLAISTGLAAANAQAATTGNLNFAGQINAGTCNLSAGDENRTIALPTVKISDFDRSNSAGLLDFELSADCESDIRNVTFLFTGTASIGNALLFANTGTSTGTALWLQHRTTPLYTIPANGNVNARSRTIPTTSNKAVIPLKAGYHRNNTALAQGTLVSTLAVSITYN